jgi:CheY-like chemotaxis protein
MRILIVEDEPFIALDIEAAIEAAGHEVAGMVDTRAGAMLAVQAGALDGALIDIRLKDGFTGPLIAEAFRDDFRIPFAFVTGNAEQLPADRMGAVQVVPKPFTQAQISQALDGIRRKLAD